MELCAGIARGSYLVCIGWTTLIVIGNAAAVGQVFNVAMITIIIAGSTVAVIVDRYNKKAPNHYCSSRHGYSSGVSWVCSGF